MGDGNLYAEHEIARGMLTKGRLKGLKGEQLAKLEARDAEIVRRITEYNLRMKAQRRPRAAK